jgi:hypothetical protein
VIILREDKKEEVATRAAWDELIVRSNDSVSAWALALLSLQVLQPEVSSSSFICGAGVEPSPLLLRPLIGLSYQPRMTDTDDCGALNGVNDWQGKPKYSENTCSSSALSTREPTGVGLGSNTYRPVGSRRLTVRVSARIAGSVTKVLMKVTTRRCTGTEN